MIPHDRAARALADIAELIGENGCDCDCGHHSEEHDDDCDRCLACRVDEILFGAGVNVTSVREYLEAEEKKAEARRAREDRRPTRMLSLFVRLDGRGWAFSVATTPFVASLIERENDARRAFARGMVTAPLDAQGRPRERFPGEEAASAWEWCGWWAVPDGASGDVRALARAVVHDYPYLEFGLVHGPCDEPGSATMAAVQALRESCA